MNLRVDQEAMSFKVTVMIQRRPDGGLRVWSDDVPGLVLSHGDPEKALADIAPALEVILAEMLGRPVKAEAIHPLTSLARRTGALSWTSLRRSAPRRLEYSASPRAA
jgi:hypothetical protein